ncbi:MAG TPA: hypothetical protein VHF25_14330 [Nitriliruptorales bacterium]|nr:hypothetical protein [Nitriliruptorales bacterium]
MSTSSDQTPSQQPAEPRGGPPEWAAELVDVLALRRGVTLAVAVGVSAVALSLAAVSPQLLPPRPLAGAAVGLAACLLAVAAAVAVDAGDRRIRGRRHVRAVGGTVAAVSGLHPSSTLVEWVDERSRPVPGFRLALAACGGEELGAGHLAEELAAGLARAGRRVLLADLSHPDPTRPGVVEVHRGQTRLSEAASFHPQLDVARVGAGPDVGEALAGFPAVVNRLPRDVDLLVAALPGLQHRRALPAVAACDHVLVLARIGVTSRVELIAGLDAVDELTVPADVLLLRDDGTGDGLPPREQPADPREEADTTDGADEADGPRADIADEPDQPRVDIEDQPDRPRADIGDEPDSAQADTADRATGPAGTQPADGTDAPDVADAQRAGTPRAGSTPADAGETGHSPEPGHSPGPADDMVGGGGTLAPLRDGRQQDDLAEANGDTLLAGGETGGDDDHVQEQHDTVAIPGTVVEPAATGTDPASPRDQPAASADHAPGSAGDQPVASADHAPGSAGDQPVASDDHAPGSAGDQPVASDDHAQAEEPAIFADHTRPEEPAASLWNPDNDEPRAQGPHGLQPGPAARGATGPSRSPDEEATQSPRGAVPPDVTGDLTDTEAPLRLAVTLGALAEEAGALEEVGALEEADDRR